MKISLEQLRDLDACDDGVMRFLAQTNGATEPVDVAPLVGGYNTLEDFMWLASEYFTKKRLAKLAVDAALLKLELIKPYTDRYDFLVHALNGAEDPKAARHVLVDARDAMLKSEQRDSKALVASQAADEALMTLGACASKYEPIVRTSSCFINNAIRYAHIIDPNGVENLLRELFNEIAYQ